jgi:N-acetylneuraminate lyase
MLVARLLVPLAAVGAVAFDINEHKITSLMAAVYTPMKGPGSLELDLDVILAYAKFVKDKNITNVMPAGSNGESLSLTVPERKALAEAWGKAGQATGLKIYMHVGSESLSESADLTAHASKTPGIYGAVCMTPVYFKPTLETLHEFLAHTASAAPEFPFWFYHFPDDTGVLAGQAHQLLDMIDQSGKIPNFMGIKYTDYDLMDFSLCKQISSGKYNMLYGRDEQALPALDLGADAAVSSTVNYAPSLREAIHAYQSGDKATAWAKQAENAKLCSMFGQFESQAKNVQKNIIKMSGMDVGPSRLPKRDLDAAEYDALKARLVGLKMIDVPIDEVTV